MPTVDDFRDQLDALLRQATSKGASFTDVRAGDLHRSLGGYLGPSHAMPSCCLAMESARLAGDVILSIPPSGKGASFTIRYRLPR